MTVVPLDRRTHLITNTEITENSCVSSFKDGAHNCAKPMSGKEIANGDPTRGYGEIVDKEQATCRNLYRKELESNVERRLGEETITNKTHMPEYGNIIEEAKQHVTNEGSDLESVENRSLAICKDIVPMESKTNGQKDKHGCIRAKVKMPMFPKVHNGNSEVKRRKKCFEKHPESDVSDYLTPSHLARKPLDNYYEIQEPPQQEEAFAIKDKVEQNQEVQKAKFSLQNSIDNSDDKQLEKRIVI